MAQPQSQLQPLLDAVERLLQAHGTLKREHASLQEQLKQAEEALSQARQEAQSSHNLSTPTPPTPALSAHELDALVEEIDSCIALLKT